MPVLLVDQQITSDIEALTRHDIARGFMAMPPVLVAPVEDDGESGE
jgi:hypothetical protein